jgi:hypothetical protein
MGIEGIASDFKEWRGVMFKLWALCRLRISTDAYDRMIGAFNYAAAELSIIMGS